MPVRNALEALTMRPTRFLRSAWPWRSLLYLVGGAVLKVYKGSGHGLPDTDRDRLHSDLLQFIDA